MVASRAGCWFLTERRGWFPRLSEAYMQVSCSLWCGGRVCTRASCTWDWSRADLKEKSSPACMRTFPAPQPAADICFYSHTYQSHPSRFCLPHASSLHPIMCHLLHLAPPWLCTELCVSASPVICFRNFSFFRRSLGNTTVERVREDGKGVRKDAFLNENLGKLW